jgi:hypothetical protein
MPALELVTTLGPGRESVQSNALSSWLKLGFTVIVLNKEWENTQYRKTYEHLNDLGNVYWIDVEHEGRYLPIDKVFRFFKNWGAGDNLFNAYCNSDIVLAPYDPVKFINMILNEVEDSAIGIRRVNVDDEVLLTNKRWEGDGYDMFIWDKKLIELFPRSNYTFGMPFFDYWMLAWAYYSGYNVKYVDTPVAFHKWHERACTDDDVERLRHEFDPYGKNPYTIAQELLANFKHVEF